MRIKGHSWCRSADHHTVNEIRLDRRELYLTINADLLPVVVLGCGELAALVIPVLWSVMLHIECLGVCIMLNVTIDPFSRHQIYQ